MNMLDLFPKPQYITMKASIPLVQGVEDIVRNLPNVIVKKEGDKSIICCVPIDNRRKVIDVHFNYDLNNEIAEYKIEQADFEFLLANMKLGEIIDL